jgi:thiamine-monophosphate kinase
LADIVLLGAVPTGKALRRSGAKIGDRIFCTGALGGAAAELSNIGKEARAGRKLLNVASSGWKEALGHHPHLYPEPRLSVGQALVRRGLATACIDISDGLSTDLLHLCEASGLSAEIHAARIPIDILAEAKGTHAALELALHGGEDYELLFAVPANALIPRKLTGVPVFEIGRMLPIRGASSKITLVQADGQRSQLQPGGWEHLR